MGNSHTFKLIKRRQSFQEGALSLFDLNREIMDSFRTSKTDSEADLKSMESDWRAVGDDLFDAMNEYEKQ